MQLIRSHVQVVVLAGFLPLSPDNDDRNIGGKPGEGSGEGGDILSDVDDMATVP